MHLTSIIIIGKKVVNIHFKIDINYVIDIQNMQEHNNNKELGSFVFESDIFVN